MTTAMGRRQDLGLEGMRNYLDSYSNLRYIITNVLFASSLEWNLRAHNTHKDPNLVLSLVDFVTAPAAHSSQLV